MFDAKAGVRAWIAEAEARCGSSRAWSAQIKEDERSIVVAIEGAEWLAQVCAWPNGFVDVEVARTQKEEPTTSTYQVSTRDALDDAVVAVERLLRMPRFEDIGISLDLPVGWLVKAGHTPYIRLACPRADVTTDVQWAPDVVAAARLPDVTDAVAYGVAQMARYVRQGHPEESELMIDGQTVRAYSWTDGVRDVVSVFMQGPSGQAFELDASSAFRPDGSFGHLELPGLLRRFCWTR